jgi:hypothetical protein
LLVGAFIGAVTVAGCSTTPDDREASSTQAVSSGYPGGYSNNYCPSVNRQCNTTAVYVPPRNPLRPPTPDQQLLALGCDPPTLWWFDYVNYQAYTERFTSCPVGAAEAWVSAHASLGAHIDNWPTVVCDACIPNVASGREYVFYDNNPPPSGGGGPCRCTDGVCMGCPGGSWW